MKHKTARLSVPTILLSTLLGIASFATFFLNFQAPNVYAEPSWLESWSYRRQLTVNSTLIDEDLSNFPVLVKLGSPFFNFSKAQDNGEDVRFTSSDGTTLLKYEIERWNSSIGKAEVWVRLPSISNTSDTDFYIYYGNPSASDIQDPENVWDSTFVMVQHLNEKNATQYDSTSYNNDGTPLGLMNKDVEGKIDGADNFDGINDYVDCGLDPSLTLTVMTIEAWVKRAGDGDTAYTGVGGFYGEPIVAKGREFIDLDGWNVNYFLGIRQTDKFVGFDFEDDVDGSNHPIFSTSAIQNEQWYYVAVTFDGTSKLYLNGILNNSALISQTPDSNSWSATIGSSKRILTDGFFNGTIDEVRISNTTRTAAWVKATYHSENDSLLTFGNEALAEEELICDVDGDAVVDRNDLELLAKAYGSKEGETNWDERCDIMGDEKVDVFDLFALGKCYGKSRQGTGVLYAYASGTEVEKNAAGNYLVYPGGTYNFTIVNITEYENMHITVWARYETDQPYNIVISSFDVGLKPSNVTFNWTIPSNLPVTTSIKFKYGTNYKGPTGTWYYARKDVKPSPRLLLVIPETLLGSLGAIIALFIGIKLRAFIRRKRKSRS